MLRTGFPAVSRTESAGPALSSKCTAPGGECTPLIGSVLASLGGVGFTPVHNPPSPSIIITSLYIYFYTALA